MDSTPADGLRCAEAVNREPKNRKGDAALMLTNNPEVLRLTASDQRVWQGIPSVEVTPNGRIFLAFYSGETTEKLGNYVVLICSDDDGLTFSEPIYAAYPDDPAQTRCFDPSLWIDPLGRLWLTWAQMTDGGLYAAVCDDPDAAEIVFSEPRRIGWGVMMNKPLALRSGEWIFPIAVWDSRLSSVWSKKVDGELRPLPERESGAFAYVTYDNGAHFQRLGGVRVPSRHFDEHMFFEREDGVLAVYVRTKYGVGSALSYDKGKTWGQPGPSGHAGPDSRFHIRRLRSGRVLLINHLNFHGRDHLAAMLSEDDGKTFPYHLMLDERENVSYPDAAETSDGTIYITYDRERGYANTLDGACSQAREILLAKITEEDILGGSLRMPSGYFRRVASKLGVYRGADPNPYHEPCRYSDEAYAAELARTRTPTQVMEYIFVTYPLNCVNIAGLDTETFDRLVRRYLESPGNDLGLLSQIIDMVRAVKVQERESGVALVDRVCRRISDRLSQNETAEEMAAALNYSAYYLQHLFQRVTGTTVVQYRNELRLTKARLLLLDRSFRVGDVAMECGYESHSYFSKLFKRETGLSPDAYRRLH